MQLLSEAREAQGPLSIHVIKRMVQYYNYIKLLKEQGAVSVSAPAIARYMGLNEVQVRKDLASVSYNGGRPKTGFNVAELLGCISKCLGYDNTKEAILVGAGNLGMALFSYAGFEEYGLRIVAAFDRDDAKTGITAFGKTVFPMTKLNNLCERMKPLIGVLCIPAEEAQEVCDLLISNGILAIWNFAPAHLVVPEHVHVQNENMASSLAVLSQCL